MLTFCFIIFMVVCVIKMAQKDKHNEEEDANEISQLPSFHVEAKPMSTFSKVVNLAIIPKNLLQSFSYSNGSVSIATQSGQMIQSSLRDLFVDFEKANGNITYTIKCGRKKISFYQTTNISNQEWNAINSVLCLAGSTRGRNMFSKEAKYAGMINMALKAIKALS